MTLEGFLIGAAGLAIAALGVVYVHWLARRERRHEE